MGFTVTEDVLHALGRDICPAPAWRLATEVQVPRADGLRLIDAVAMHLAGKEQEVHGFEIKVSRGDWLNELRKPEKARPAMDHVDRFWLVAGARDVYQDKEVPAEWGIIIGKEGRLEEVRPAQRLHPRQQPPRPLPRAFTAAFVARLTNDGMAPGFLQRLEREAEQRGYKKAVSAAKRRAPTTRAPRPTPAPKTAAANATPPARPERRKYDPGRYNFDDGVPLDLP